MGKLSMHKKREHKSERHERRFEREHKSERRERAKARAAARAADLQKRALRSARAWRELEILEALEDSKRAWALEERREREEREKRIAERETRLLQERAAQAARRAEAERAAQAAERKARRAFVTKQLRAAQRALSGRPDWAQRFGQRLFAAHRRRAVLVDAKCATLFTLQHDNDVSGVLMLQDGRLLTWSRDKTLRLWATDGTAIAVLRGHTAPPASVSECKWNGADVVSVSLTETIYWNTTTKRAVAAFGGARIVCSLNGVPYSTANKGLARAGVPRSRVLQESAARKPKSAARLMQYADVARSCDQLTVVKIGGQNALLSYGAKGAVLITERRTETLICDIVNAQFSARERILTAQKFLVGIGVFDKDGGGWKPAVYAMPTLCQD